SPEVEADHAAISARHLTKGDLMVRVRFEARVEYRVDLWVIAEHVGDGEGVRIMPLHSKGQTLDTTDHQPGDLRCDIPAVEFIRPVSGRLDALTSADDHASRQVARAPEVFGRVVDDRIDAELERRLVVRCGKSIIGDRGDPSLTSYRRNRLNISN